jgi:hypothetical protein
MAVVEGGGLGLCIVVGLKPIGTQGGLNEREGRERTRLGSKFEGRGKSHGQERREKRVSR